MPVKDFFRQIQPFQLYALLALTTLFFITEMIVSQLTHSLTLLMDAYHVLCNIFALIGCIATIKYGSEALGPESPPSTDTTVSLEKECQDKKTTKRPRETTKQERKLRNTFGWTRIDVITMLICCVFMGSFCFSVYMEALQTLGHIDHQDAMHHPISVLCLGCTFLTAVKICKFPSRNDTKNPEILTDSIKLFSLPVLGMGPFVNPSQIHRSWKLMDIDGNISWNRNSLRTQLVPPVETSMDLRTASIAVGAAGLVLNGLCYLLIGGFTFHQGSFLYVTESGDVVLNKVVVNNSLSKGARRLSRTGNIFSSLPKKRQGLWEMVRDINGCAFVIICSVGVIFTDPEVGKFIDPILSLVSATSVMFLSYPYIKESCMILLQTMPDSINIDTLKMELIKCFPDIINVHDLHVWQLTASKVISTVHIIFENPKAYRNMMKEVKDFFLENGVTQVTIQPEYFRPNTSQESLMSTKLPPVCLVACQDEQCKLSHCCQSYEDLSAFKSPSKELLPEPERVNATLKSVKRIDDELNSLKGSESTYSMNSLGSSAEHGKSSGEISRLAEENAIKEEEVQQSCEVKKDVEQPRVV